MVGIILSILKIIGIILLSILGILIALLLIVLFVPVRYSSNGYFKEKELYIYANVSFLLHILHISCSFKKGFSYSIRILGIKLNLDRFKKKHVKKVKNTKSDPNQEETGDTLEVKEKKDNAESSDFESNLDIEATESSDTTENTNAIENTNEVESVNITENNNKQDSNNETEKVTKKPASSEKATRYLELLTSDEMKGAISACKHRIGCLFKTILPRKGYINIRAGFGNAGILGEILGAYKAFYAYIGHVIHFYPCFNENVIDVNYKIKGKITVAPILYHLIRLYFDKNFHYIIKQFLKK